MWSCIMASTPGTVCLSTSRSGISVYQSFPGEYSTVRANRSGSSSGPVVLRTTALSPTVQLYQCVCGDGWITFTGFICSITMELLAVVVRHYWKSLSETCTIENIKNLLKKAKILSQNKTTELPLLFYSPMQVKHIETQTVTVCFYYSNLKYHCDVIFHNFNRHSEVTA